MSYDTDILHWSEQQADLLRRMARGERVNGLDWDNVIEEVESVGRSELRAVESQLRIALIHLILAARPPRPDPEEHWRVEARAALTAAGRLYAASMSQRIRLDEVWQDAWEYAAGKLAIDGVLLPEAAPELPFTLPELTMGKPDLTPLIARLTD